MRAFPLVSSAVSITSQRFPFSSMGFPARNFGNLFIKPAPRDGLHGFLGRKLFRSRKPKVSYGFLEGFQNEDIPCL